MVGQAIACFTIRRQGQIQEQTHDKENKTVLYDSQDSQEPVDVVWKLIERVDGAMPGNSQPSSGIPP
jgi:hypothetical protein